MNFSGDLQPVNRLVHSKYSALRKCCGCIHLRAGGAVSCVVWAGLSFYFAILAFMNESPFYSYIDNTALMVFGAINLIFALVALSGLGVMFINRAWYIRNLSHAIWSSVFIVLVDIIINLILFIINRQVYNSDCVQDAATRMGRSVQAAFPNGTSVNLNFTTTSDFYNCDEMWQDELKFSILSVIVIFVLYVMYQLDFCFLRFT
ncbi:hypothetical protein INT43_004492 [Umbelopsis isabellina]|uniref:Uncharacterized protein n=1 Tax=Mortierella isabellina TaxID=91625 RepID=A0A8H7PGA8_MORIS|nr:hypothetical protein INT43_004492 [Umbelopsis isabellina]